MKLSVVIPVYNLRGYDERVTTYGAEDLDIVCRLRRTGCTWKPDPAMFAVHQVVRETGRKIRDDKIYQRERRAVLGCRDPVRNRNIEWGQIV